MIRSLCVKRPVDGERGQQCASNSGGRVSSAPASLPSRSWRSSARRPRRARRPQSAAPAAPHRRRHPGDAGAWPPSRRCCSMTARQLLRAVLRRHVISATWILTAGHCMFLDNGSAHPADPERHRRADRHAGPAARRHPQPRRAAGPRAGLRLEHPRPRCRAGPSQHPDPVRRRCPTRRRRRHRPGWNRSVTTGWAPPTTPTQRTTRPACARSTCHGGRQRCKGVYGSELIVSSMLCAGDMANGGAMTSSSSAWSPPRPPACSSPSTR